MTFKPLTLRYRHDKRDVQKNSKTLAQGNSL